MAKKNYKIYNISCGKCSTHLLTYHKYGAGKGILRLYHAHIVAPESLCAVLSQDFDQVKAVPNLACTNEDCQEVLGVPALSKGGRWVYRMRQGYFHRKLVK